MYRCLYTGGSRIVYVPENYSFFHPSLFLLLHRCDHLYIMYTWEILLVKGGGVVEYTYNDSSFDTCMKNNVHDVFVCVCDRVNSTPRTVDRELADRVVQVSIIYFDTCIEREIVGFGYVYICVYIIPFWCLYIDFT